MNAELFINIALAALIGIMGILILIGKGDKFISGYNTASPEERAEYNIRRLRLVMGVVSLLVAVIVAIDAFLHLRWLVLATVLPASLLAVILGNTWAKN